MIILGPDLALLAPAVRHPRHAARMTARLGSAVCDQAIFSGAPFVFTVLLARWMTQTDFGAFSVAFTVYVLLQNVFEGLVYEPFAIFGSGRLLHLLDAYTGRLLISLLVIGVIFTAVIMGLAVVMRTIGEPALASAFSGLSVAVTFLLARVLIRQPLYITSRVYWSVCAGGVYFVCTLFALCLMQYWTVLTPFAVFLAMGVSGAISSSLIIVTVLKPAWRSMDAALAPRTLIAHHVAYGKWAIGERLLLWVQTGIFYFELPLVADLHASAAYRALSTLAMPAAMTMTALWTVLLPMLVRVHVAGANPVWARLLMPAATLAVLAYGVALVVFGKTVGHFLFAGQYDADLSVLLLTVLSAGLLLSSINGVLELKLRATLRVRLILIARIAATVVLVLLGLGLTARFQLLGALIALALICLTTLCVLCGLNWQRRKAERLTDSKLGSGM